MSEHPGYPLAAPERQLPPPEAAEREMLTSFLDFQRATLAVKCAGLTAGQLRARPVPPSALSLLGLVRHLAEVERNWFRPVFGGEPMAAIFSPGFDPELAFARIDEADATLDVSGDRDGQGTFTLRWILIHLIEEYARHNGHADLIRERLDGVTGQ
jgi:hypothetical protein